ncbi:MAG TPA: prolipoprotein diacylglyceryl transferase family protein [Thermoanaerobaculia bacterium]|nr:prolipoprotein diacylglyceryl transferase family protein [Thermoanaerobaculia bacterium]
MEPRTFAVVRPTFRLGGRRWPFYGFFVCTGITAGALFAVALGLATGLAMLALVVGVASGLVAAGALALTTELFIRRETYTFYHYQLAVLAAGAGGLALGGHPLLPCLDVIGPALALVQAFGRLGCLMAGCCHGRPHRWGVRYGGEHVEHGLDSAFLGVRLFPIQAVESLCLFALAIAGAASVLSGRPAGTALATYLVGYGALRFALEFARGDAARPYALGFSEAQWTAGLVVMGTTIAEAAGLLPFVRWHLATAIALAVATAMVTLHRRLRPTHRFFAARHVSEVAAALVELAARPVAASGAPLVSCTSLGLRLSAGALHHSRAHYALSGRDEALTEAAAKGVAALILRLRHPAASSRLIRGDHGVFHLLVEPRG